MMITVEVFAFHQGGRTPMEEYLKALLTSKGEKLAAS
jgi:hypothetical protein